MLKSIKTTVVAAILIGTAVIAQAQKKVNEGTLTYGMTYELTPEQKSMASQLPAETKFKFNGNILKIEMEQGPAKITILSDGLQKTGLLLVDVPIAQKQFAVKVTKEETEESMGKTPVLTDFKATGEKKKIGTYDTEKYTYKDDKGVQNELWATTDIQLPEGIIGEEFKAVKGTPVVFTRTQNGVKATVTIKNLNEDKVGPLTLDVPPSYELTTMDALRSMGGQ
ncbi:hypothetical protein [Pedobacter antarcticus]|uniref:DUF4412 domain-containing protein n=2 Tax=Pedobacter antarcticus TaxID=34086 RepID=A0A081PHR4_9SPHI|nr:hypothetical protein [Pedobacter antarcticus]KEQ30237.1 hypothetical protein N180_06820 [Pedobacter antarcticus 4BY]SDL36175.1 hypothetical protein SAMN04488084_10136 [Pedobacter antarcticus]SFE52529.1 hypothetical protein SAMN03003324_00774 [Pedobacter antarcticus]